MKTQSGFKFEYIYNLKSNTSSIVQDKKEKMNEETHHKMSKKIA